LAPHDTEETGSHLRSVARCHAMAGHAAAGLKQLLAVRGVTLEVAAGSGGCTEEGGQSEQVDGSDRRHKKALENGPQSQASRDSIKARPPAWLRRSPAGSPLTAAYLCARHRAPFTGPSAGCASHPGRDRTNACPTRWARSRPD